MTAKMYETMAAAKAAAKTGEIGVAKHQGALGYVAFVPVGLTIPCSLGFTKLVRDEDLRIVYFSASSDAAALKHFV